MEVSARGIRQGRDMSAEQVIKDLSYFASFNAAIPPTARETMRQAATLLEECVRRGAKIEALKKELARRRE